MPSFNPTLEAPKGVDGPTPTLEVALSDYYDAWRFLHHQVAASAWASTELGRYGLQCIETALTYQPSDKPEVPPRSLRLVTALLKHQTLEENLKEALGAVEAALQALLIRLAVAPPPGVIPPHSL